MSDYPDDDGNTHRPAKADRWRVLVRGRDDLNFLGGVAVRKEGISVSSLVAIAQGKTSAGLFPEWS
jgi:hypothetical protein